MRPALSRVGAVLSAALLAGVIILLSSRIGAIPPVGTLLDPADGLYRNARAGASADEESVVLRGLSDSATVYVDERGVPHIFASETLDGIRAMGYLIARDRLFQYDFIARVAAGRLSELLGASTVEADRFLRNTGMEFGARRNARRIAQEGGLEADVIDAYCGGVNAYLDELRDRDLPLEFRIFGGRPTRCDALQVSRLVQYMAFDLSYQSDEAGYGELKEKLGSEDFELLYPQHSYLYVPIVDNGAGDPVVRQSLSDVVPANAARILAALGTPVGIPPAEGFRVGKGSNNWAVGPERSATGSPILAGDVHLSLTLPAIWYEIHMVTPEMNTYGVTIPGAPLPVEAFNDYLGWTFTNTGADQIDHYRLELDSTRTRYRYEDDWRDLEAVVDTIHIAGGEAVIDTLFFSHWGPVFMDEDDPVAIQWVAHKPNRTLRAIYEMNRASDYGSFVDGLRYWDAPMQNILYAGRDDVIAIRSTGHLPIRQGGHGMGLLDGSSADGEWIGRVPFDELPHAASPEKGYLTSTNQQPATPSYPHYLGFDWRSSFRSLRAEELLSSSASHGVEDLMRYQRDVVAMQHKYFSPMLDSLERLSPAADSLRRMMQIWDGETAVDRPEPLVLDEFLAALNRLTWDEEVFNGAKKPAPSTLYFLLTERPASKWFDRESTPIREHAGDVLRLALEETHQILTREYGPTADTWQWGEHHQVIFRHITGSEALRAFWRGPYPYPGFNATLSPAADRLTTHSASWRVVVDFSTYPPSGFGIYPGGQSGDPLSPLYDLHVDDYVHFRYNRLENSDAEQDFRLSQSRTLHLRPSP